MHTRGRLIGGREEENEKGLRVQVPHTHVPSLWLLGKEEEGKEEEGEGGCERRRSYMT